MLIKKLLKQTGIVGLSIATFISAMPLNTVYAGPTGPQSAIPVKIDTVAPDEVGNIVYNDGADRVEDYTGVTYDFVDSEHGIEYDPNEGLTQHRDVSRADFAWLFATGTQAELEALTTSSTEFQPTMPQATHVSESTFVRILVKDNNGIFSPKMSRVYEFKINPIHVELELDDSSKEWGTADPDPLAHFIEPSDVLPADTGSITYTITRDATDENNSAEKRENVGSHAIIVKADKTALGDPTSGGHWDDYEFVDGRATLTIEGDGLADFEAGIDASDTNAYYDKEPHGIEVDESQKPDGCTIGYEYSDDGGSTWTTVTNIGDTDVTNANVDSDGTGNGRKVKITVTGSNGSTNVYGPYTIKVKKIPITIGILGGVMSWDKSAHGGNDPTSAEIKQKNDDGDYVFVDVPMEDTGSVTGGKYLIDGDYMTFDVALTPGSYAASETPYVDVINFSNCKVMSSPTLDNTRNYHITQDPGDYLVTNENLDALKRSFTVTGFNTEYNGRDHYVTASGYTNIAGTGINATLTYQTSTDNGATWSSPVAFDNTTFSMKNVGSKKVKVTASLGGTEGTVSKTVDAVITKKTASINAQPASKKKDREDPTFTANTQGFIKIDESGIDENPVSGTDYTVARDKATDPEPEKVGTHAGVIKVNFLTSGAAKWNNYNITVQNADFRITDPNAELLEKITVAGYKGVYDGHEHSVTFSNVPAEAVITYSLDNGNTWVTDKPMFKDTTLGADGTNAAAQAIKVKFTIDDESIIKDTSVLITRKTAYIRVNAATKTEDEPDPEWSAAVSGVVNKESFDYTITRTDAGDNTLGTHKGVLVPTLNADYPNYSIHLVSNALTITRGQAYTDVQKFSVKGWSGTYDGASHTVSIKTSVPGSEVTYSTEENGNYSTTKPSVKHVKDSTTVYVKCTKGKYEKIIKTELTVKRRSAAITVNNATKVQGDPMPEFSAYTDNLAKNDKIDYNLSCTATDSVGAHSGAIKCTISGEYPDYTITVRNGTLTVTKKATETNPDEPAPTQEKQRKGETTKGDDSKDGAKTSKDKVQKGEVIKDNGDNLNLIDRNKYIIGTPDDIIKEPVARFAAPEDGLEKVIYEGEPKSLSTNSANEADPANHRAKAGSAAPYIVGAVVAGAIAVGMGVTGAWSLLWLLLLGLLFKKKRKHWKGLLTYENNMFIKIKGDVNGVEDMQDIINKGVTVEELRALMSSSEVETILPARTQMSIDIDGEGEQKFEADEDKFYEILEGAKGKHAIINIFNPLAKKLSLTMEMDCK